MVVVLVLGAGAAWESAVVSLLADRSDIVVLKRCVDVDELLASATAGQAEVAVVGLDAPGLDQAAVDLLQRHQVRPVAVVASGATEDSARLRAARIGIASLVAEDRLEELADAILHPEDATVTVTPDPVDPPSVPSSTGGRVVVVWGPAGAPGRTTVATSVAAELARRGRRTTLVDADPYGGAVAQQLGVLDEVSGLLAAARLATSGELEGRVGSVQRALNDHLTVVSGLPRPDRWAEVRSGTIEHLLEVAREHGDVVVDTGFSLEEDPAGEFGSRPPRNSLTLGALSVADDLVVVGSADPVGLSRLARGLVELRELVAGAPVRVVVNRMRPSLGWSQRDIEGMVEGFARLTGLHFLPDDRPAADRAAVAGRAVTDDPESPLARALSALVDALAPATVSHDGRRGRRRKAR